MVFEAIVVDVLNRFLGAYVENLNRSQLKIGIWGGDVVLENLVLKQNALEELNIPVQIVYGHLGKLVLKIPWKNLYGASVEATVEKLFLIVNPTAEVKYDPEKEDKQLLASKQAELLRIEEAKKQEALKDEQKVDDSFVEKLVTQIIKNVQLKISDIHVRYEDSITNPSSPFSLGFTLHNLSVHTTDDTWKQTVIQEAVSKIFKILNLEGLALYWNTTTLIYAQMDKDQIIQRMRNEIATKVSTPNDYSYVLGPINSTAKLKLNPKPEFDLPKFSIPKCILSLHMEQLSISITKSQYQDMIKLAESMERMSKGAPYRKYRPFLKQYKGYYKEWWKFAYTSILEEEVRRRRKNWDWNHMSMHRSICRDYAAAYQTKLTNKGKVPNDLVHVINKCERHLDLFNLVVIRHRIEVEVERLGKAQEEANKTRGWFSSWWGNSTQKDEETSESTAIMKQFEAAMTGDEKAKLFRAIDYQENSAPLHLPVEFVALECHFQLDTLSVTVTDMARQVLRAMVEHVQLAVLQRPSASGLKVDVVMQEFSVLGVKQQQLTPKLVSSHTITPGVNLLNVSFEMNPLSNDCGQRIHLSARPLEIIYDAQTIIEVVNVFKVPADVSNFSQLQAVAGNKLSGLKEKSVLGLQHSVSLHTYIDVNIDIAASHIIVPNGGIYTKSEDCLVVNLGAINVKSEPRSQEALNVHKMFKDGLCDEEILKQVLEQTYDKFLLELTDMQVLIAHKAEDWQSIITSKNVSRLHLLQPTTLKIQIQKCLIADDPRLSKIKVRGQLEKITVNASEDRLLTLLEVAVSMPLPESEPVAQLKPAESKGSNLSLFKYLDPSEKKKRQAERKLKSEEEEQAVQLTELEAVFVMNELIVNICRKPEDDTIDCDKLLTFTLQMLEVKATQKTFTMEALVRLGAVGLLHYRPGFPAIDMISTPSPTSLKDLSGDVYLFTVSYINVDKKCPDFRSHYGSVEQLIKLEFTTLRVLLHLEGLQQILVIGNEYGQRINNVKGQKDRIASAGAPLETIMEDEEMPVSKVKTTVAKGSKRKTVETIQLKVSAIVGEVDLEFATDVRPLAIASLHNMQAALLLKNSYTQVDCSIHELKVLDLNPQTIHKEIIKVIGGDVLNVRIVLYNLDEFPNVSDTNMSVDAELNCIRIVFLNWFVSSMLEFMNNFQAAQQAMIDASNVAADAAKMNVQSAYENSTKIALRVKLKAPIIIVPENSMSENALLVDLGYISVSNKFFYLEVPEEKDRQVSVEEMALELEDMQVGCVHLRDEDKARGTALLEPISFKLAIKRSLSSWFHMLPALDVSGRMKTITITVTHSDFKMIMKVLNENLSEGQTREPEPQVKATTSRVSKIKMTPKTSSYKLAVKVEEPKPVETPRTTVKFSFAMDSLVINLKTSAKNDAADAHLQDVGLAMFCMTLLSFKGRMISDGSMHCALLLVDCTLDDMRPARGSKITRYLERRPETGSSSDLSKAEIVPTEKIRSMLDVTYTLKHSDTFIDVRVFSFNLILAVDFLLKVADFLTSGMAIDASGEAKETEAKDAKETNLKPSASHIAVKKKTSQLSVVPPPEPKKSMMTINLKVEQPEIILVESLEHKDGEALIMNIEVLYKLRSTEDRLVMEGSVTGLQLYRRAAPTLSGLVGVRGYVLEPSNFSLAASQVTGCGMHADLAVSDIQINVSPATINLLSRVMSTITKSEESSQQVNDSVIVYDNLWDKKPFTMDSFWFLKTEIGEDAIVVEETELIPPTSVTPVADEICLLSCPCLILSIEMAMGNEAIPVIALKSSLKAQVKDWSSQLNLESTCSMQISYYNISKALWEPLLEPVEVLQDNQYKHIPWELKLEIQMNPEETTPNTSTSRLILQAEESLLTPEDLVSVSGTSRAPGTTVTISSSEPLELTLTCTAMDVLQHLGNSFLAAIEVPTESSMQADKSKLSIDNSLVLGGKFEGAPYVLHNCTGLTARVLLRDIGDFSVYKNVHSTPGKQAKDYREVVLESSASVPLQLKHGGRNLMTLSDKIAQLKLHIQMVELEEEVVLPVERAVKRYFPLRRDKANGNESRGLLSEVMMHEGAIHIYLRSVVQVRNNLSVEVNVFYMTASGNEVRSLGTVAPDDVLRLPLQAIYTPTSEIFFSVEGFTVSVSPFVWRDLQQEVNITKLLQCESKDRQSDEKFYMRAIGTMEQVYLEDSTRYTLPSACFEIVLRPAVIMQNCLPVELVVSQLGQMRTQTFAPGEMFHLPHLTPNKATVVVMLPAYLEKCWVCTNTLPDSETEFSVWSLASHDSPARMLLELGMHSAERGGSQMLELYCPFWMLNKTGLTLAYRKSRKYDKETESPRKSFDDTANVLYHPHNYSGPILFSFRAKNFFGKKKASIRVEFGDWSDKFSLDIAGSSGLVICKNEGRTYQVAVTNQLTFNSLTKMVIFTPYFLLINNAPFDIECQELSRPGDAWIKVEGNSSKALWPRSERDEKLMLLRVAGSQEHAAPFIYTDEHNIALKLNNQYGGIHVETQLSEWGTYVQLRQYREGHAPALIVNCTDQNITLYEKDNINIRKLPPMHHMLFTWDNPAGPRILIFEAHKKKEIENDLRSDGIGEFLLGADQRVYWVSFLNGMQRVLLFTCDVLLAHSANSAGELGGTQMQCYLSIQGLGLSLVNNTLLQEILYISISNSGIIWEQCKLGAKRYKKLAQEKTVLLEDAYQRYLAECLVAKSSVPGLAILDKMEVNFETMRLTKPNSRLLRRTLEPGLWFSLGMTAHRRELHAKLNRLQIDQQLPMPMFPVILAPVPPPRSVASEQVIKPFAEVSIVERLMEHTAVKQYKYFKVLIQEFHVKVDMILITALMEMFPQKSFTEAEALAAFALDLEKAAQPMEAVAAQGVASDQKNFYDNLHLSPLKVHLSFSMAGATQLPTFLGTILQGIGVTLTDMNDVIFKLGYYEKNYEFMSQRELITQSTYHYTGQAIKQLYVLVLGLDVIGNPYGLVVGLKQGVEDLFYEPFQGAIQGPGEFAEGLYIGVRSLVGHAVGGAAGAVSRIAGAMGSGLAALSLDEEYQRRRRDRQHTPATLHEGLARSGKGLVMGVFDGVTGVFTKPVAGAREQGVEGFFKGLGRGAVGLVARPTAGVVDFASGSLDAVKRATDMSEETVRYRPPRYLRVDGVVRPYSRRNAEGYKLLNDFDKGKYSSTDKYVTHVWVQANREVVLCTDKRILSLEKNNVFGGWQMAWSYLWQEIPQTPYADEKGLFIPVAKKKVLGMFASSANSRHVTIHDEQQKRYLATQCERLMREAKR